MKTVNHYLFLLLVLLFVAGSTQMMAFVASDHQSQDLVELSVFSGWEPEYQADALKYKAATNNPVKSNSVASPSLIVMGTIVVDINLIPTQVSGKQTRCRNRPAATECPYDYINQATRCPNNVLKSTNCPSRVLPTHCQFGLGDSGISPTHCPYEKDHPRSTNCPDQHLPQPTNCPNNEFVPTRCGWLTNSTNCPNDEVTPTNCPEGEISPTDCPGGDDVDIETHCPTGQSSHCL